MDSEVRELGVNGLAASLVSSRVGGFASKVRIFPMALPIVGEPIIDLLQCQLGCISQLLLLCPHTSEGRWNMV